MMTKEEAREIEKMLIRLWDNAVGSPDYDKRLWRDFQTKIHDLFKQLGAPSGWGM